MYAMNISMISALALGLLAVCVSAGGYGRGAYGYGGMQAMYPSYGYAHMVQPYVAGGGLSTAGFSVGFSEIFYYIILFAVLWWLFQEFDDDNEEDSTSEEEEST